MQSESTSRVLPYAATRGRSYRRMNIVAAAASAGLLAYYYVGLVPIAFSLDYTRSFSLIEAVSHAASVPPWALVRYHEALFMPLAIALLTVFLVVRQATFKLSIAIVAVVISAFVVPPGILLAIAPILFFVSIADAIQGAKGETWSEGFIAYGAVGGWMILWSLIALRLFWIRKKSLRNGHGA